MSTFWFYDIDLNYEFTSKLCPTNVIVKTIKMFGKIQDKIPKDVTETLNEIKCLQTFLAQENPDIVEFSKFDGNVNQILIKNDNSFYYLMNVNNYIVVIGINDTTLVRYEVDYLKQTSNTSFKHMTYGKGSLDTIVAIEKDLQYIYAVLFPQVDSTVNRLEAFNE